ncbi:hypothetical protein [Cognatishimia maritima]|uniref:Uncharacterized protein n=1 Tax=Cognatishimia maritima TaxID=870908 RepID=A0A1M5L6W3_9RHOB|nr:hypothetical protein [Cognatishimia maritima]SHG60741.1 hypothetical protein SAMN04488044_1179 [Cognatishimia maritima]
MHREKPRAPAATKTPKRNYRAPPKSYRPPGTERVGPFAFTDWALI